MTYPATIEQGKRNAQIYQRYLKGISLADIGRLYGLTRERIRQIVVREKK